MKRWNLIPIVLLVFSFLAGCGQTPVKPEPSMIVQDVRMDANIPFIAESDVKPESSVCITESVVQESETAIMTEPIPETESTESSGTIQTEQSIPQQEHLPETCPSTSKPKGSSTTPATQAHSESTPTSSTEPTTVPSAEPQKPASTKPRDEDPTDAPSEWPTEPPTAPPTEKPTEPPTEAPTEPPTEPQTEAPTEPATEAPKPYDLNALITYANTYAKNTYGFAPDSSLNLSNASYYPGFYGAVSSEQDLYTAAISQIQYAYACFQALGYDLEGLRCNLHAAYEAATGMYYLTFLYG